MRYFILLSFSFLIVSPGFGQSFVAGDYQIFGRKEPVSMGSVFGALGTHGIMLNPANLAFVLENRITNGAAASGIGDGLFISWIAPNLTISSSTQKVRQNAFSGFRHEKKLLHFGFGISTEDLGLTGKESVLGFGVAFKRQADRLLDFSDRQVAGGHAVSMDVGVLFKWRQLALELIMIDVNTPQLSSSGESYGRGFVVGGRLATQTGLTIAVHGTGGGAYEGSDFGLSFAAEQPLMQNRLVPRIQLSSFFAGSEATMQNLSASLGYRLDPTHARLAFLKDLEVAYALSFLALPQNVGTHVVSVTKFF